MWYLVNTEEGVVLEAFKLRKSRMRLVALLSQNMRGWCLISKFCGTDVSTSVWPCSVVGVDGMGTKMDGSPNKFE